MVKSMKVASFIAEYVPKHLQSKFHKLMLNWDGQNSVSQAFYDIDVLHIKLRESKE